jgi:phosphohistidine phosphatase
MDLILWRHAEAEDWPEGDPQGGSDLERSLTSRGEKQAARMANWLDRQLPEGARIFVSPARRCEQTALALGRKYKIRNELAPDATVEQHAGTGAVADSQVADSGGGPSAHTGRNHCALGLQESDCPGRARSGGCAWH